MPGAALNILDIGGRYQPYRPLFGKRSKRYIACDIVKTDLVDVVGSGEALPFAAESFDVAVATQVFDYFPDPKRAAEQIQAVLKRGGALLSSMPAVAPRFSDREYWRFTASGIRMLLSCFSEVSVVAETSSLGGLTRTIGLAAQDLGRGRFSRWLIERTVCAGLNLAGLAAESIGIAHDRFAANFSVLAIK